MGYRNMKQVCNWSVKSIDNLQVTSRKRSIDYARDELLRHVVGQTHTLLRMIVLVQNASILH